MSEGSLILISGATGGLGSALTRHLAGPNNHLILLARQPGPLEALDDEVRARGGSATLVPGDLMKTDTIENLGAALFERFGRLDGFIPCAVSLGVLTPTSHTDSKVWNAAFNLNVTVNQRMIRSLEPLLRLSPSSLALMPCDDNGSHKRAYWSTYAATKAAFRQLALCWQGEQSQSSLDVTLISPPVMASRMRALAHPGEDPSTLTRPDDYVAGLSVLERWRPT